MMFQNLPKNTCNVVTIHVGYFFIKIVTKNFQRSPNLVTLSSVHCCLPHQVLMHHNQQSLFKVEVIFASFTLRPTLKCTDH